jgi:Methyltransferase domain
MIATEPDLTLYDPRQSVALRDSTQLVEVGVMRGASPNGDGSSESAAAVGDYVARMHEEVPGWFTEVDASLFRAVDAAQRAAGVRGDLLEVGVYLGKSAVLLGYLLRPDEELVAWDLFSGERLAGEADAQFYRELTQAAFEENYARFHARAATAYARPSSEIPDASLGRRFRFVHVDGSHRYEIARDDITAALDVLVDGGVLVVDDYRTLPHAMGVAAAVWEAVTAGRLVPVLASDQKLYGFAAGREAGLRELLQGAAHDLGAIPGLDLDVAGHAVTVLTANAMTTGAGEADDTAAAPDEAAPPPDSDEVAELRRRLELIENSRTWRWRAKLARLLPTRR